MTDPTYWFVQYAVALPLLVTLVVGFVICHRQRKRKPRVAKLLEWAILLTLLWRIAGFPALVLISTAWDFGIMRSVLFSIPGEVISTVVWSATLWAVLVSDNQTQKSAKL